MGAPIVVNTVKVQGTVTSTILATAPAYIAGTATITNAASGAIYTQATEKFLQVCFRLDHQSRFRSQLRWRLA